jgi:hypothetical protein
MPKRISWRQRLANLTGDRDQEAKLLARQVVAEDVARPRALQGDPLLEAAKEAVAAAHGDGAHSDHVDPATELASPEDVIEVARAVKTDDDAGAPTVSLPSQRSSNAPATGGSGTKEQK